MRKLFCFFGWHSWYGYSSISTLPGQARILVEMRCYCGVMKHRHFGWFGKESTWRPGPLPKYDPSKHI